jgi:polysaccharide deacetylase 2 family uncharacterized protein YibQ
MAVKRIPPSITGAKSFSPLLAAIALAAIFLWAVMPAFAAGPPAVETDLPLPDFRTPAYEVFPEESPQMPPFILLPDITEGQPDEKPRVAIIIDDVGYHRAHANRLMGLGPELTLSILPASPFADEIRRTARVLGMEVMVHMPMEPEEYPQIDPGPGALLTGMTPVELMRQLNANLDAVPDAVGVNNHMGSRLTTRWSQMYQILSVLKRRSLFFIDSRTSGAAVSRGPARLLQLPFACRDVFLDHDQTQDSVRRQIRLLVHMAHRRGEAVGIGHPYGVTVDVLTEMMDWLREAVHLVPASRIVHTAG